MSSSRLELPCLAFHRRDDHTTSLYTMSDENTNLIAALNAGDTVDEILRNKTICPTARGFLLARDPDTMATFLWRPEDGNQIVHLPPLEGLDDGALMHSHCLLSDEPSAAGCVVLLVEGGDDTVMWYCRPGDDDDGRWVKHEYDVETITLPYLHQGSMYQRIPICPIAACRGKFYFNGRAEDIGVLEFCPDPVFTSIAIDDSSSESEEEEEEYEEEEGPDPGAAVFLVESAGELYRVSLLYARPFIDEIDEGFVQRLDFSKLRWRDAGDLGGRTFLLSSFYFGASCSSDDKSGLEQDCVYFVRPWRKEMQVFNVKEDTNELHRLDGAPPCNEVFWLLPSTSTSPKGDA